MRTQGPMWFYTQSQGAGVLIPDLPSGQSLGEKCSFPSTLAVWNVTVHLEGHRKVNKASVTHLVNREFHKALIQTPHLYNHSDNELKAKEALVCCMR